MTITTDPTKWQVKSIRLQRPENVFFAGKVRPWDEAVLHVSAESVVRGINVFEGLKGYWQPNGDFGLRTLRRHYDRLTRSARLLHIPVPYSYDEFEQACFDIANAELRPEKDLYIRATLFVIEGHYGEGTVSDLVLTAYQQRKEAPDPIDIGLSTWRRSADVAMPARIKSSANYQVARLAHIEGRGRGYDEMVLLNDSGRVAEGIGSCLLMVRDGHVYSPPASEGALESITLEILGSLAESLDVPFSRRPVDRSELYLADEMGVTGTLSALTLVRSIDDLPLSEESPILSALKDRYLAAVRGTAPHPAVELTIVRR